MFYALGFTVVQSYVYKNGFEGMFWFTNEFYRDAGAVFILDLIRVPMLAPYIFFPYFLILFLLIPKEENLRLFKEAGVPVSKAHWTKTLVLLAIMAVTAVTALYFDAILGKKFVIQLIDLLRRSSEHTSTQPEQSLAFCCLVTPIIAVVSIFFFIQTLEMPTAGVQGPVVLRQYIDFLPGFPVHRSRYLRILLV